MQTTFGVEKNATEQLLFSAGIKLEEYKSYLPDTINEIAYLKNEIEAISSFITYHEIQPEREKTVLAVFRRENEYGYSLDTHPSVLGEARDRLSELEGMLKNSTDRENKLNSKISFLEKDIVLLKNMLKSSPRSKIIEYAVPPFI